MRHDPEVARIFREMQLSHHQHRSHREQVQQHAQHHVRAAVDETRIRGLQLQESMSLSWRTSFGAWRMAAMAPAPLPGAVPGALPLGAMAGPLVAAPPQIGLPQAPIPPLYPVSLMAPPPPLDRSHVGPMQQTQPGKVSQEGWFPEF